LRSALDGLWSAAVTLHRQASTRVCGTRPYLKAGQIWHSM